jgi:hypothetical protein
MTATIQIHRPDHPNCNADGDLTITVEGDCGPIEAPSRHCPGDPGDIDVQPGPFELAWPSCKGLERGATIDTELTMDEEREAERAIREAVYDELRGTAQGRRVLGRLG